MRVLFCTDVRAHPLKEQVLKRIWRIRDVFKKRNRITYWTGVIIYYDLSVVSTGKQSKGCDITYANFGGHSFNGLVQLYLTWDLDDFYKSKVSTELNEDDIHSRTI